MSEGQVRAVEAAVVRAAGVLPDGAIGIDAGLTLTKIAQARGERIALSVHATSALGERAPSGGTVIGATGARITATLLNEVERRNGRYGLQTMCEGGGQANVTIIERL